jgi:hypothetical protein
MNRFVPFARKLVPRCGVPPDLDKQILNSPPLHYVKNTL